LPSEGAVDPKEIGELDSMAASNSVHHDNNDRQQKTKRKGLEIKARLYQIELTIPLEAEPHASEICHVP
jgi:hypothetical protein